VEAEALEMALVEQAVMDLPRVQTRQVRLVRLVEAEAEAEAKATAPTPLRLAAQARSAT
jgi:hypothetical protein